MHDLLYCFISHESVLLEDISKWTNICNKYNILNYIIVCGNKKKNYRQDHVLFLSCDDTYEGLSDKIYTMFNFLIESNMEYKFYAKIDRYINLLQPINLSILNSDYCGSCVKTKDGYDGNRWWHKNKCSKHSQWNNKPYPGKFIPWCRGGSGYFLSNKAAKIIGCNPPDLNYHIYEDLYVAETLLRFKIQASHIFNLQNYLIDPDERKS
jgi:hypothetical protein